MLNLNNAFVPQQKLLLFYGLCNNFFLFYGLCNKKKVTLAINQTFVAAAANFVILIAIIKGPISLKKPQYWFTASLAVADSLTGFGVNLAIFVPIATSPLSQVVSKNSDVFLFVCVFVFGSHDISVFKFILIFST